MRARLLRWLTMWLLATLPAVAGAWTLAFNSFEPWKWLDAGGQPQGPYYLIVREMANRAGAPLQLRYCPLARCLAEAERGGVDLLIGVRATPERGAYLDYLSPPFAGASSLRFVLRRDDRRDIRRYEDLAGWRIGVVAGSTYFPRFDVDLSLERDAAPNAGSSLRKLLAGRVDVVVMNQEQARVLQQRDEFRGRLRLASYAYTLDEPRRIAIARHSPLYGQKAVLERALAAMVKDGTARRLMHQGLREP